MDVVTFQNGRRENFSFFYFLLYCCIREKKRKTTYTTTTTTTIFYSHYSGTRRSRKKKETTENEMMKNVLPQFLELTVKLIMLKLNCPFRDSAYRFGISVSTVSWIFDKSHWYHQYMLAISHTMATERRAKKKYAISLQKELGNEVAVITDCF